MLPADGPVEAEQARLLRQKEARRKGLVLADEAVLQAMDAGEESRFLPVKRSKTGALTGDLATEGQLRQLKDYVFRLLARLVDGIAGGQVEPNPYVRGNRDACRFCAYASACHLDLWGEPPVYRAVSAAEFWEQVEKEGRTMAETLTRAQRAAVENQGGPLLGATAAGSGKTKVLVDRLMGYLCQAQDPANLDEFLIITYTRGRRLGAWGKIGARLTRASGAAPENRHLPQRQVQRLYLAKISTVHAFCGGAAAGIRLCPGAARRFSGSGRAGVPGAAAAGHGNGLEAAYGQIDASPALQAFVDTQGFGRDDRAVPGNCGRHIRRRPVPPPAGGLAGGLPGPAGRAARRGGHPGAGISPTGF